MPVAGEPAQRLLALGVVLGLEIAVLDAGLLLELLGAGIDALVEGFVELAAEIVDDGGLERRSRPCWAGVPWASAGAADATSAAMAS